jgi:allantoinase
VGKIPQSSESAGIIWETHRLSETSYPYSAIADRTKLTLPSSARLAVLLVLNIENWYLDKPARSILATPAGAHPEIDVPNFSWHEYGMRVGFWRMKKIIQKFGFHPTIAFNGSVVDAYSKVAEACREPGWEIMGHGFKQRILPLEPDEEQAIIDTKEKIKSFFGSYPRGWLSPGLAETRKTLGFLAKNGFEYVCDWVNDDQPYEMTINGRTIYSIPYTLELNDIVLFANQHFPAEEFFNRVTRQFDVMYSEGSENPRIMAIAVHPYISGVPHRIQIFEKILEYVSSKDKVLITTGSGILELFKSQKR